MSNKPVCKITNLSQKICLMFFGVFCFIIILETGLRLGGWVLISLQEHKNRIAMKQKGAYRILCLGESTTDRQYPFFLEETLNQNSIGIIFSVIDKGMDGAVTFNIVSRLEFFLEQYRPDMVITMMGINDFGNHVPYESLTNSKIITFLRSFRVYKLVRLAWLHALSKFREIKFSSNSVTAIKLGENYNQDQPELEGLRPKSQVDFVNSGVLCYKQGRFVESEALLKKAIEFNSISDKAFTGLGWLYRTQGRIAESEIYFKEAILINPDNDWAYVGLGWVYRDREKVAEAEDYFRKAIAINPKNDGAYFELGLSYHNQGKFFEAEDYFKKAISLNPGNIWAYIELGWLYRDQGRLEEAEEYFQKQISKNPKDDIMFSALEMVYTEMGNLSLAEECRQKANELRLSYYSPVTVSNYHKLKEILDKRGIKYVCMQYPMRSIEPLKKIFKNNDSNIIFVDNEKIFKDALKEGKYRDYFTDSFGGDFGHCTDKGNRLLAENIARVIIKDFINKIEN